MLCQLALLAMLSIVPGSMTRMWELISLGIIVLPAKSMTWVLGVWGRRNHHRITITKSPDLLCTCLEQNANFAA